MDESPTIRVRGWPSLGGWLVMLNGSFWIGLLSLLQPLADAGMMEWLQVPITCVALFMSLPFACIFMLPGGPSREDPMAEAIGMAIVIGLNAFAWGYGLAWLIGGAKKWIAIFRKPAIAAQKPADGV